jgi:CDP-paratose 2-epimerase
LLSTGRLARRDIGTATMLITGGAGFVGSNLAVWFKERYPDLRVIAADNLKRRGSEVNLPRLRERAIEFVHCDIRNAEDLRFDGVSIDVILECSAEPSVLAGYADAPDYLINTNLVGTVNCLELARRRGADLVFLSTSRVYPIAQLNAIATTEAATRFVISPTQVLPGVSERGVGEAFPLAGPRSLYGATKLCSELLIQEYRAMYGVRCVVDRCGVLAGPWQMGKADQGVFALWMARHYFGGELGYIGWGGTGKQVRDLLHIDELADLVDRQLAAMDRCDGETFNVGGGSSSSLSLQETTRLCEEITGRAIPIRGIVDNRPADVKVYIADNARVADALGWAPARAPRETLVSIYEWLRYAEPLVRHLWEG